MQLKGDSCMPCKRMKARAVAAAAAAAACIQEHTSPTHSRPAGQQSSKISQHVMWQMYGCTMHGDVIATCSPNVVQFCDKAGTCRKAALTPIRSFLSRRFCCIRLFRSGLSYQRNFLALSTGRRRYCCDLPACDSGEVPAASPGRPSAGTCRFCLSLRDTYY